MSTSPPMSYRRAPTPDLSSLGLGSPNPTWSSRKSNHSVESRNPTPTRASKSKPRSNSTRSSRKSNHLVESRNLTPIKTPKSKPRSSSYRDMSRRSQERRNRSGSYDGFSGREGVYDFSILDGELDGEFLNGQFVRYADAEHSSIFRPPSVVDDTVSDLDGPSDFTARIEDYFRDGVNALRASPRAAPTYPPAPTVEDATEDTTLHEYLAKLDLNDKLSHVNRPVDGGVRNDTSKPDEEKKADVPAKQEPGSRDEHKPAHQSKTKQHDEGKVEPIGRPIHPAENGSDNTRSPARRNSRSGRRDSQSEANGDKKCSSRVMKDAAVQAVTPRKDRESSRRRMKDTAAQVDMPTRDRSRSAAGDSNQCGSSEHGPVAALLCAYFLASLFNAASDNFNHPEDEFEDGVDYDTTNDHEGDSKAKHGKTGDSSTEQEFGSEGSYHRDDSHSREIPDRGSEVHHTTDQDGSGNQAGGIADNEWSGYADFSEPELGTDFDGGNEHYKSQQKPSSKCNHEDELKALKSQIHEMIVAASKTEDEHCDELDEKDGDIMALKKEVKVVIEQCQAMKKERELIISAASRAEYEHGEELAEKHAEIKTLKKEMRAMKEQLVAMNKERELMSVTASKAENAHCDALAEKDTEIMALKKGVRAMNEHFETMNKERELMDMAASKAEYDHGKNLAEKDTQMEALKKDMRAMNEHIEMMNKEWQLMDMAASKAKYDHDEKLAEKDAKIMTLKKEMKALKEQSEAARKERELMAKVLMQQWGQEEVGCAKPQRYRYKYVGK